MERPEKGSPYPVSAVPDTAGNLGKTGLIYIYERFTRKIY